jgi:hypothetical protein
MATKHSTKFDYEGNPRRNVRCLNCSQIKPHAARGLCGRCYMEIRRDKERARANRRVDRHATAQFRERNNVQVAFNAIASGLNRLHVDLDTQRKIRVLLEPWLLPIKDFLGGPDPFHPVWTELHPADDLPSEEESDDPNEEEWDDSKEEEFDDPNEDDGEDDVS